jgi:hypothetical protein
MKFNEPHLRQYLKATQFQHPYLAEFCDIDMEMVEITLGLCLGPDYLMPSHRLKPRGRLDQVLVS